MSVENEMVINQAYDVPPTADQVNLSKAKELLRGCKQYVQTACNQRDYEAYALMDRINLFLDVV